jgi:hypothetical protein
MPSFMTFGPVSYKRCENQPTWLATDPTGGKMTMCGECKDVCEKVSPPNTIIYESIKARSSKKRKGS